MSSPNDSKAPVQQQDATIDDEAYNSDSDSDFDPEQVRGDAVPGENDLSGDEGEAGRPGKRKRDGKPTTGGATAVRNATEAGDDDIEDAELDSGDEVTIRKYRKAKEKKKRRKGKGGNNGEDEDVTSGSDEGGEGGLIKTRAQRAREGKESKPLATLTNATVDVDAVWASMMSGPPKAVPAPSPPKDAATDARIPTLLEHQSKNGGEDSNQAPPKNAQNTVSNLQKDGNSTPNDSEEMITIKRTYDFAGETVTEEKRVPRSSAEARLYLQSQEQESSSPLTGKPLLRRPKKRASMFEPNPTGAVKGLPLTDQSSKKGPKLNTIEKSKLDWAGFVDKEGIANELDEHSRAKEGYMGRMDFLGRVEAKRDEEWKSAKKS
ncbi:MAG: Transcription factor spt20 [Chaenotheca gracillima]|nr:MAG: Transcription factor spt20 [Chaenotheca gracillima]